MEYLPLILIIVVFGLMMWWQTKSMKKQQTDRENFVANLKPGTEVITIGGVIGKVVEVDAQYEEIVIESEGSKLRFGFKAIAQEYTRPAYVSDDEVDENGNPLQKPAEEAAQAVEGAEQQVEGAAKSAAQSASHDVNEAARLAGEAVHNGEEAK